MGKEGIYNSILSEIERMVGDVAGVIDEDLKGARPFDKEVVSPKERLIAFAQTDPQVIKAWQNSHNPEVRNTVNNYIAEMQQLLRRSNRR